jgi:hypothetical protein
MPGVEAFVSNAAAIYIEGNGGMAFGVLVPISYLLIFSTVIFLGMQVSKYALLVVCAVSFICVSLLDYYGMSNPNLSLLAVGILGMVLGQYPLQQISNWAGHWHVLAGLYVGYLIAINIWGERYFLEVIGVCLSVSLIYSVGVRSIHGCPISSTFVLLGKYSLFAYIAQIGLLQLLQASLATVNIHTWGVGTLSFVGAFALTIITVWGAHQMCSKSSTVDRMYRLVFA